MVEKLVDADGDGVFADEEDAHSAASDVTFRITLANVGEAALEIVSVVDQVGAETLDLLAGPACSTLGDALAAGSSVTCDLTIERYLRTHASQPRSELTNVVEAVATDGEVSIAASDDATVHNPNALVVSAAVDLTNDADGDGVYTDDEEAPHPLGDVPVRIEVANTSPGAVVITELVGDWDGGVDLLATACPALDGMKLWGVGGGHEDGGDHDDGSHEDDDGHDDDGHDGGSDRPSSVVCLTTLAEHAPGAGASRTDTVTVTLGKRHSPDRTASATDTTTVWLPVFPGIPGLQVSLGIAELGRDLQFDEWVAIRLQHDVATWVQLQAAVSNSGATPLVEPTLDAPGLSMADCSLPDVLAVGEDVVCDFDLVLAEYGDHEFEVTATAMGAGELLTATSSIGYSGFVQNGWPDDRPPDDGTPAPVPTPAPVTPTGPPADAGGASPDALAFTGFAIGPWAGAGLASLLLGLALLLATGGIGGRAPARSSRRPAGRNR